MESRGQETGKDEKEYRKRKEKKMEKVEVLITNGILHPGLLDK